VFGNTVSEEGSPGIQGSLTAETETEAGTLSNTTVGSGRYYLNNAFSFAGAHCVGGAPLVPRFTAPNPVNTNEIVGFDGMESNVGLGKGLSFGPSGPPTTTYATFTWNFGDGTGEVKGFAPGAPTCEAPWLSPCAASVFHSYQYGGKYEVTLTVTDVAGNIARVSHEVTVAGPPPPGAPGGSGSGSGAGTSAGQTPSTGSSTGATVGGSALAPIALATILPQGLRSALRRGLAVGYSVNEQVAGRFEVLLSRSVAHRLGISGSTPANMAVGSEPQLVIAKAVLVTTKGGHSSVRIQFSKHTAARLGRLHKVSLMLRLSVRNGASSGSASTTVMASATLAH